MILNAGNLKQLKESITFKVLKIVFSIYFIITLSVTLSHMYAEYKNEQNAILNELQLFGKTFNLPLSEALWNIDIELIESAADGILKNPNIIGFDIVPTDGEVTTRFRQGVVKDKDNKTIYIGSAKQENAKYLNTKLIEYKFELYHDEDDSKQSLGIATFYTSKMIVLQQVKMGFVFILVNAAIKTLALWYLFMWGGIKYLSRPLGKFASAVESLELEDLREIKVINSKDDKNELVKLQDSFNLMTNNLRNALKSKIDASNELEYSEKYLQDIFNSMPSALITIDMAGNISHCNSATYELLNLSESDSIGKNAKEVLNKFESNLKIIDTAIETNTLQAIDKIKLIKDKSEIYYTMAAYPLKLSKAGVVVRIDDITAKVGMENMMVQTEKMSSLGTLAAGMAHEINNPLGGIIQGIQNVKRRLDPDLNKNKQVADKHKIELEAVNAYLQERGIITFIDGMSDLGKRAAGIVKNVLKFSRKDDCKMSKYNVNNMVNDTISILSTDYEIKKQIQFKELELIIELDKDIPDIMCSPSEIEQVLLNLMKNAAHALSDKEHVNEKPYVLVRTKLLDGYVRIEVEDNGPGINEQTKKHLFEPFFTTKAVGIGTGLGLSISFYIIVDKHLGKLDVESEIGSWTKFIIELPINQVDPDDKSC